VSDTKKTRSALPKTVNLFAVIALGIAMTACSSEEERADIGQCENAKSITASLKPIIGGDLAAFSVADEPTKLPLLSYLDRQAKPTNSDALKGKTILFNLWATWCAPCRKEMPAFDALEVEFGGDDFAIIPVSVDRGGSEKPLAFYEEIGLENLPFYQDETMGVFNILKKQSLAFGLPVTLLLDEEGCILGSLNGPAEWASEDAKTLIRTALDGAK